MRSASAAMPTAPSPQERPATADCRPTAPRRNRQARASALAAALFATSAACFFFGMQAQHAVQDAACALTLTGAGETAGRLLAFAAWVFLLPFPTALSCCAAGLLRRASRDGRMPDDAQGRTALAGRVAACALAGAAALAVTATFCASLGAYGDFFPTRWSDGTAWGAAAEAAASALSQQFPTREAFAASSLFAPLVQTALSALGSLAALAASAGTFLWAHDGAGRARYAGARHAKTQKEGTWPTSK